MGIVNNAHRGFDGVPTAMGVIGTLGTSDIGGTAQVLPIAVDPITGAAWQKEIGTPFFVLSGGTLQSGTMTNTGTNVNVVTGTINVGTFNNTGTFINVSTGTLNVGTVAISNTPNVGTITTLPGIPSGTINVGTFTNLGTNVNIITGSLVGTVTSNQATGTLNVGTVVIPSGTINVGTFTNLGTFVNVSTGSLIGTILGGTIQNLNAGSIVITTGTINTGTVSSKIALTASAPAVGTVGTSSAQLVGSNTNRKGLVLINTSANNVNLAFNAAAVGTTGVHLTPNGVYYMDEYTFNLGTVNAVASAVSSLVTIAEYTT